MNSDHWQTIRPILESALELAPPERDAYLDSACNDPIVRKEVESLLAAYQRAGEKKFLIDSAPLTDADQEASFRVAIGKRIGVYKVLAEIAVGGMGAVYRAIRDDGQYEQQVALKIVRAELGSSIVSERFKNERQILANLNHPNIAKILDGGTTSEGISYLVMEFIDGLPITDYCDRQRLDIDSRLRLFRAVCAAVQCAHQHLIVHRDIKPTNILVTADGIPKLLDFGIAKILHPDAPPVKSDLTVAGHVLMTPQYASPEQFSGEPITTATDVYALGLLLYELLTGCRAHFIEGRTLRQIANTVVERDPIKPSEAIRGIHAASELNNAADAEAIAYQRGTTVGKLRRKLSGDLDNIVMKALRKNPADRYESVDRLSEDVRHHLDDEPVQARKISLSYQFAKFVARNKLAVASFLAFTVCLIAASLITLHAANVARAEKARAERRFNDVRELANSFVFDVHDAIQFLPGSTAARQLLVRNALKYLDSLAQEAAGERGLQTELAASYEKLGDVQGGYHQASLGDTAAAIRSYQRALQIRAALYAQAADDSLQRELIRNYGKLSNVYYVSGDLIAALHYSDALLVLAKQMVAAHPTDFASRLDLARAQVDNGWMRVRSGKWSEVHERLAAGRELLLQLHKEKPDDALVQRLAALASYRLSEATLGGSGEPAKALDFAREAVNLLQPLLQKNPLNTDLRNLNAHMILSSGAATLALGLPTEAMNLGRRAIAELQALVDTDPNNGQFRSSFGVMLGTVGTWTAQAGDLAGAIRLTERAVQLSDAQPDNLQSMSTAAVNRFRIGDYYDRLALQARRYDPPGARKACEQARRWNDSSIAGLRKANEHNLLFGETLKMVDRATSGPMCAKTISSGTITR